MSGDMTVGALLSLGASAERLKETLDSLQLGDEFSYVIAQKSSYGIAGTDFDVILPHHHHHEHGEGETCEECGEEHDHAEHDHEDEDDQDEEGHESHGPDPWRWIDAGIRAPEVHRHLDGERSVELMPWFWAAARADPHNVEAWGSTLRKAIDDDWSGGFRG